MIIGNVIKEMGVYVSPPNMLTYILLDVFWRFVCEITFLIVSCGLRLLYDSFKLFK